MSRDIVWLGLATKDRGKSSSSRFCCQWFCATHQAVEFERYEDALAFAQTKAGEHGFVMNEVPPARRQESDRMPP